MTIESATCEDVASIECSFKRLDMEEETDLDDYTVGVLDVFPYILSENEAEHLLSSFENHNLKYEVRFIETIRKVFYKNGKEVLIYCPNINEYFLEHTEEESLLTKDIVQLQSDVFKVTSDEYLEEFIRLSTRELLFSNFYFTNIPAVIIGNYDLSFPVYCLKKVDFDWICKQTKREGLFIRQ